MGTGCRKELLDLIKAILEFISRFSKESLIVYTLHMKCITFEVHGPDH